MINRLLVANRGEIARRIINTCSRLGIQTVAVYSDPDAEAPHVREADFAVRLPGSTPSETYLRGDLVIAAARTADADAIHPGYGFLSENAQFANLVRDSGLCWIGPEPETIKQMGSKIRAKEIVAAAGVPVLTAESDTFPQLVKASAGGGGRGMRIVRGPDELDDALSAARAEAESAFGDGTVFVEPYLPAARHVEVQILADKHGNCWVLGDRDCTIQRRHQKLIEEAPAPSLTAGVRERLHRAARAAANAVGYVGAGTVEFLVDSGDEHGVSFLEMNTRLQVEHSVTECVYGLDLVALQLHVAEGRALPVSPSRPVTSGSSPGRQNALEVTSLGDGHAIEVRLYAEDPADGWRPQTGTVQVVDIPDAHARFEMLDSYGIRVDASVEPGSEIGVHYDPLLAKVIAWAPDRSQAVRMLSFALRRIRLHGVGTNVRLLRSVLDDPGFQDVRLADTRSRLPELASVQQDRAELRRCALAAALAQASAAQQASPVQSRVPVAYRNVLAQPRTRSYIVGTEEIAVSYRSERGRLAADDYQVLDAGAHRVRLCDGGVTRTYDIDVGNTYVQVDGPNGSLDLQPVRRFSDPEHATPAGSLLAPMPATVAVVEVEPGRLVRRGQRVLVLEAMKMRHPIEAPVDGVVTELGVTSGQQVDAGVVLAVIEPVADQATSTEGGPS